MKIMVVSDTHGAMLKSITDALKKEQDVDMLVHCGDKFKDAEILAEELNIQTLHRVPGNCDYDTKSKTLLSLEIEGKYVLITHGHLYHVKDGLEKLKRYAEENHADIVIFGHTHRSLNKWDNNILYFNPGSTILPKEGRPSYGIIKINNGEVESEIIEL